MWHHAVVRRPGTLGLGLLVPLLLAGCTMAATIPPPSAQPPSSESSIPAAPSRSPSSDPSPPGSAPGTSSPVAAAATLAGEPLVRVEARVERNREGEPEELLITADALVDPASDRGHAAVDFAGMLAGPSGSPMTTETRFEIAWDPDWTWTLVESDTGEPVWARIPRAEAADRGGLLGRMPDELLGLLRLAASATDGGVGPLPPAELDGQPAARFTVPVSAADVVARGIPAPSMSVAQFTETYGMEVVNLETWLVGGQLRRIVLVLERERALYGGPDRTETIHDVRPASGGELEVPPSGTIEDR